MGMQSRISRFFGAIAGVILWAFGKGPGRPNTDDLRRAEFKTSTQRMGVRFSEKVRDVFRFKWIRRASRSNRKR